MAASIQIAKPQTHSQRILHQALVCVRRGWAPIPVSPNSKKAYGDDWPHLRLNEEELPGKFGVNDNIGVLTGEPSGNLDDVDLDAPEAVALAGYFLPSTQRIHGRKTKPRSHHWYKVDGEIRNKKFCDIDNATVLVELRSTGLQTVIPPSIHPTNERIVWDSAGEPGQVTPANLQTAVNRLASAALIVRHYPDSIPGRRHTALLALGRFLLDAGFSEDEAEHFVQACAREAGDEKWKDRGRDVRSTAKRLSSGQTATGIPTLVEFFGELVVAKLTQWLGARRRAIVSMPETPVIAPASWPAPPNKAAFYGLAGDFVRLIEPHSEGDAVALLAQLLVAFGNVAGRTAHFRVESDFHYANLNCVLVGPTSKGRKGSSLGHVKRLLEAVDSDWVANCIQSGLSSGEGLIWSVRDAAKPPQHLKRRGDIDIGVEDKRLLIMESEFAQPLKLMTREGNILSTVFGRRGTPAICARYQKTLQPRLPAHTFPLSVTSRKMSYDVT
jgi:hypothetical protein